MSINTTANDKVALAKEKLDEAYDLLLDVLRNEDLEYSGWSDQYVDMCHESALEIKKIKRKL